MTPNLVASNTTNLCYSLESQNFKVGFTGMKSKCHRDAFILETLGNPFSCLFFTSNSCPLSLVCGPISLGLLPSSHLLLWLWPSCLPLLRTLVTIMGPLRKNRKISPSKKPQLNHICRVPLTMQGNIITIPKIRTQTSLGSYYSAYYIYPNSILALFLSNRVHICSRRQ